MRPGNMAQHEQGREHGPKRHAVRSETMDASCGTLVEMVEAAIALRRRGVETDGAARDELAELTLARRDRARNGTAELAPARRMRQSLRWRGAMELVAERLSSRPCGETELAVDRRSSRPRDGQVELTAARRDGARTCAAWRSS